MNKIKKIFCIILSVLYYTSIQCLLPLIIVSCAIFIIYRKMVDIILRQKLGKQYGGLLEVADSIMITTNDSKYVILNVLIAKSVIERDTFKIAKEKLKNKVFNSNYHYPKLTSTLHMFGGYPYWIRNNYKLEDCLRSIPISEDREFDEKYLMEITGRMNSEPFQKNNTGLWDVAVSQKPLKSSKDDGFFYYPIIVRINHAIGDGTSLIAFLIQVLGDGDVENYNKDLFKKQINQSSKNNTNSDVLHRLLLFLKEMGAFLSLCFYIVFIGVGKVIKKTQLSAHDKNTLHGPKLCGEKLVAWHVEDNITYFPMVKRTKNRVPNTKFSNVIMTAVSASLTNFFVRNFQPIPENTTTLLTTLLHFPKFKNSKPVKLENKTTLLIFELPSNKANSLVKLLENVKEKIKEVTYGDLLIHNFLITKLAGIFPISITTKLLCINTPTSIITNVPGGSQVSILDGYVMDKVIPLAPNIEDVGVTISLLSYDDRFQLGVLVDKAILSSQQEVQRIADDVFYYIKLLDIETKKLYNDD